MIFLKEIASSFLTACKILNYPIDNVPIILSKEGQFGDYQVNIAMSLAKQMKKSPREIANCLCEKVDLDQWVSSVEIAGPGFVNLVIKDSVLLDELRRFDFSFVEKKFENQVVVVDYSSPNLAKEMHVGHLRSTIIGDAISRMYEVSGAKVIRQNHVGDWGTQFGMLLAYATLHEKNFENNDQLSDIEQLYVASKALFDSDASFKKEAQMTVKKLQTYQESVMPVWQSLVSASLSHCQFIYDRLNVKLLPENVFGESFYQSEIPHMMESLRQKSLLVESDGALCVFLPQFITKDGSQLPAIIQKSDGGYSYMATDLAALFYRANTLNASRVVYVVGMPQKLHFEQLFSIAETAQWEQGVALTFCGFGSMLNEKGQPFKTREGKTVKLNSLIDLAIDKASELLSEKNELPDEENQRRAEIIAIGAMKYADLSKTRTQDYVFNTEKMLAFTGNTAPYIQYAYTRICSLFNKAGENFEKLDREYQVVEVVERNIVIHLLQFEVHFFNALESHQPSILCQYLYQLACLFMKFYETCGILNQSEGVRLSRLSLCAEIADCLRLGLNVLGIEVLTAM